LTRGETLRVSAAGWWTCPTPACQGLTTLSTSGTALSLTSDTWDEAKVVVGFGVTGQRLRFWVDTLDTPAPRQGQADGDSDYSDEATLLDTNTVDDVWSAGYAGLYRHAGGSTATSTFPTLCVAPRLCE
jgi:hypothetical protein